MKYNKIRRIANSIVAKIFLLIFIMVFPINILLIAVTGSSMRTVENQTVYTSESTLNTFVIGLDRDMEVIDTFLLGMMDSGVNFWKLMQVKDENREKLARFNLNNEFGQQILLNGRIAGLFWYAEGKNILLNVKSTVLPEKAKIEDYLVKQGIDQIDQGWHLIQAGDKEYLMHIIRQHGVYVGGLISVNEIIAEIEDVFEYENKQVCLTQGPLIPKSNQQIIISSKLERSDDMICSVVLSREEVLESLPVLQRINYYLAFLFLLSIPLLLLLFRKILLRPLWRINKALQRIEKEGMDYRMPEYKTSYEFTIINHAFNDMMSQIKQLKIKDYESKLEKNKMELKNLQLQINPHFLLNTFNIIYSLAQMRDYASVQKMVLCLTTYYRDGIRRSEEFRTIKKELDFVNNYIEIAKMRYPDCFEVIENVEKEAEEIQIPAMLIQVFVENAIQHNVRLGKLISIQIEVICQKKDVIIKILDDGDGIDGSILKDLNSGKAVIKRGEEHIGIWNCRKRLNMIYGEQANIYIRSQKDHGTVVQIFLPEQFK